MGRRTIGQDELDQFELDDDGRLYWQGERVLTDVRLSLSKTANVAVVVAAIATFGLFTIAILQAVGILPPAISITNVIDRSLVGDAETRP